MSAHRPLIEKRRFTGIEGVAHLCTGGEAPPLKAHLDAAARFFADKADGMAGRARFFEVRDAVKGRLSGLLRLPERDIGFLLNASDGMATAVAGLDLGASGNIVVARSEYVSLPLSAHRRALAGGQVRLAGSGIATPLEDYEAHVDSDTRAILVSHVSHLTGIHHDLAGFRALADTVGARLIVDVSHSLGAVPIDGSLCDALVSCCYKWQLGTHGCGIFAVNRARWSDLEPLAWGWNSIEPDEDWTNKERFRFRQGAERFETGNAPFLALYLLDTGLSALCEVGEEARANHVRALSGAVREALVDAGLEIVTPAAPEARAGNVSYLSTDPMAEVAWLRSAGVHVWGGEGRVRISTHVYNDGEDVAALRAAIAARPAGMAP